MPALSKIVTISLFSLLIIAAAVFAKSQGLRVAHPDVLISKNVADGINSLKPSWIASEKQGLMTGATRSQIKRLLGYKQNKDSKVPRKAHPKKSLSELPASFEAEQKWPHCPTITEIRDQASCGSCFCVSSASAMSDRFCTYGIAQNRSISCSMILSCCWLCGSGCNGGDPVEVFSYAQYNGVTTSQCDPYPFPECAHHVNEPGIPPCGNTDDNTPACSSTLQYGCTNNQTSVTQVKYFYDSAYSVAGETDFMQELMEHGPFVVGFSVYADFPSYKSGVYKQTSNDYLGGHAVRIVGWGTENGEKYWRIANSWNAGWGENGYFKILRGVDECGIEDSGASGVPSKKTA